MKTKLFVAVAAVLLVAAVAYAQTGFAGKWVTDPPAAGAGGGRGGGGETRLDLKVDGSKVTGTIFEGGAELMINEGTIAGKQAKFKTQRTANNVTLDVNWTADLTDENTITLNREFPNGIPAGFLGGGGGGRGGGGGGRGGPGGGAPGGGAPAAGGAPAGGGAAPAAPAAPAAGAAPAGGGPAGGGAPGGGGGGRGAGGAGGGGGRGGAPAAVTLHRAKA